MPRLIATLDRIIEHVAVPIELLRIRRRPTLPHAAVAVASFGDMVSDPALGTIVSAETNRPIPGS